ncbi:MAG: carbamoyltransferase HypF [Rubrivivax sp. SCN 70-15]|nr:MAG: carbamoyltransferase HypF [Rubrivivax sp. SCN 70-15]
MVASAERAALRVSVAGRVQGVGFRPFVYRLALRHGLAGAVCNRGARVEIEVCGERSALDAFVRALLAEAPALAEPVIAALAAIEPFAAQGFRIDASRPGADTRADAHLPPDRSLCDDCRRELADPADRRWRHPFINCTQCGPRYTVIGGLPYDRDATSLAGFAMCAACRREYDDPLDRRFHAEPIACPDCGPRLRFVAGAREVRGDEAALAACVQALRDGAVVAVKGIGGYHLMCDAMNEAAIATLRARKARPHKPLAVMFAPQGTDGLQALRAELEPDDVQARALRDPARAIVLVRRCAHSRLPAAIAPGLDAIGALLPYSPLHELLLADFGGPLVATSGNLSGEPVLTDEAEAARRLGAIADAFLHHDRPILRPADDPVLRVIAGHARPVRPGRGTAPLERALQRRLAEPVLALGGQSKITLALGFGGRIVLSPHLGDLDSPRGRAVFEALVADLPRLYGVRPARLIVDRHPGLAGTRWARTQGLPVTPVTHHHAHASALAWERPDIGRWLVLAWDGVGLGEDGTLWGGEALVGAPGDWQRAGSWRPFRPPGGERAAREPWRSAAALCWEAGLPFAPEDEDLAPVRAAWRAGLNAPATPAVGRLFDAAAALILGLRRCSFEAQGPMALEALAGEGGDGQALPLPMADDAAGLLRIDWAPLLDRLRDTRRPAAVRAADFHATLAEAAAVQALALRERHRFDAVGLAGGVFQNRRLVEQLLPRLARRGLDAWLPHQLPVNDGGLAFGQVVEFAAAKALR